LREHSSFWAIFEMKTAWSAGALLGGSFALLGLACPQLLDDDFKTRQLDCEPFSPCDLVCVDLDSDPSHCGACDSLIADDQICSSGTAVAKSAGCGALTLCSGGCVKLDSHPFFCGSCDNRCKPGSKCMMGRCMCAAPTGKDCGDECRECCSDADCPMEKQCSAGVCEIVCVSGQSVCGDRCVSLSSDPRNCGRCRNDCGPGRLCNGGVCG
jgi:hypothetical protein